jgi:hypothetical protein
MKEVLREVKYAERTVYEPSNNARRRLYDEQTRRRGLESTPESLVALRLEA